MAESYRVNKSQRNEGRPGCGPQHVVGERCRNARDVKEHGDVMEIKSC